MDDETTKPARGQSYQERRGRYLKRYEQLKTERSTWLTQWRDISDYIRPGQFRYLMADRNKGTRKDQNIVNNTATIASRTLAAGMMQGMTPRSQPWFRLGLASLDIEQDADVKAWLFLAEKRIIEAFARSNIYNCLHDVYQHLGDFCTAPLYLEEDPLHIVRGEVFPIGQYVLANSSRGIVDTVFREFGMTVDQMVEKFGLENCGRAVQDQYKNGALDTWHEIIHVIEPRRARDASKADPKNKPWSSSWFEKAGDASTGFLRESGYEEFPVCAPRWNVTGEDVYGRGPGFDSIGDARALQLYERRKAQGVERIIDPATVVPSSMRAQRLSLLPGKVIYRDRPNDKVEAAYIVPPEAVEVASGSIKEIERRLNDTYFTSLFMSLTNDEGPQMTAEEVRERRVEKLQQLGPAVERVEVELLDPLITRVFGILLRGGYLPPPPRQMQGADLSIRYTSIFAQAAKLVSSGALQQLAAFVANLMPWKPDAPDKVDTDKMIEGMADALDVDPGVIISQDQVAQLRQQRAQQQAEQAQTQNALAATQGAKNLADTDMGGDSALTRLLPQLAGTPQ